MKFIQYMHNRLGDFWWYSLMLFCACRAADLLNAFVGMWLVPKYVEPSELGAVMPLTQFANFLAIPIAAFANTFRNELTRLSIGREFGRLKTLMRGVFVATAVFLFLSIIFARFMLPAFLERIRIAEGSLGLVIIAASFVGAIAPIYSNALQALKKFKAQSLLSIIGAPVRLLTMLAAMPFRALTGYFVGQASVPIFNIIASVFTLRKELSVPAKPYWTTETLKKFSALLAIFMASGIAAGTSGLVESTVLRQRLPDLDSAGYYMATRFSEIAGFLYCTLVFTIFPFAAGLSACGKDMRPIVVKASLATFSFGAFVALPFLLWGKEILALLPHGDQYAHYWWAIPWLIAINTVNSFFGLYNMAKVASNSLGYMKYIIALDFIYAALLLLASEHGYFSEVFPRSVSSFLNAHNICSLDTMLWWMSANATLHALYGVMDLLFMHNRKTKRGVS